MPASPKEKAVLRISFVISLLLGIIIVIFQEHLFSLSPFFQNPVMKLYLRQLFNALIALPFIFIWLELSRNQKVLYPVHKIKEWWLSSRGSVIIALIFFALATITIAIFAYHRIPKGDALWPYFQTKIFARACLFAPAPFDFRFFATPTIIHNGKWFSYVSPGHALTLLPFYLLNITWLAGPLLGTIAIWLLYRLTYALTDRKTARIALLLGITSPFMLFLFGSHEFHVTSTFFTILALFSIQRSSSSPTANHLWSLLAGLALGIVFLSRPYTAIGVGIPLIIFFIIRNRRGILPFSLAGLSMVFLHLLYNHFLTGNPLKFPYQLMGAYHGIGFSPEFGAPTFNLSGHSPFKMLINLCYNIFVLSLQLYGWLFLSGIFLIFGITRRQSHRLWLIWAPALGLVIAYLLYWFHGITPWGPKYWSEALPAFIIITAIGIRGAPDLLGNRTAFRPDLPLRLLPFLILYSLLVYLPVHFHYFASGRWGETPKIAHQVWRAGIHNAVVFIHTDERSGSFDYTSAFIFNDPFLKADVIYPRDLGEEENRRFLKQFPGRAAYIYDFNNETFLPLTAE